MKRFVLAAMLIMLGGFGAGAHAQGEQALNSQREQNIRRLLQLTKAGELGAQVIEMMIPQIRASFDTLPAGIRERVFNEMVSEMRKEFSAEKMVEVTIPIYAKYLTDEEVLKLIGFYESPAGLKAVEVMPQIMKEAGAEGQRRGLEAGQRVIQKLLAEGILNRPSTRPAPQPARRQQQPRPRRRN
ncbi:MAG TPA: DUF2059 domain-containing protein [Pyrinomonadaceae bacterium]|nr:DUF2059 domain-containing protein [Pyrinomonadaceae bacterium]